MGLLSQLAQPAKAAKPVTKMVVFNACFMIIPFYIARVIYPANLPTPALWDISEKR